MTTFKTTPCSAARDHGDAGFMLVEIMFSAVALIALSLATFAIIDSASNATSKNRARSVATTLGQADQDEMRQMSVDKLIYRPQTPQVKTVDGRDYSVTSSIAWVNETGGQVSCTSSGSGSAQYIRMTTKVDYGGAQPQTFQTLRSPTVSQLKNGAVSVKLQRRDGVTGTAGITVTATGSDNRAVSGVTDAGGCVILGNIAAGFANVKWNQTGYVDQNGIQAVTNQVNISKDETAQAAGNYDNAGNVTVAAAKERLPVGQNVPTDKQTKWTSFSAVNNGITSPELGARRFTSNTSVHQGTANNLFPFLSPYSFYIGRCTGNAPTTYNPSASEVTHTVTPGSSMKVVAETPTFTVEVVGVNPRSGYAVYAAPKANESKMAGCNEGIFRGNPSGMVKGADRPPLTGSDGKTEINLPYGIYNLCVDNNRTSSSQRRRWMTTINITPDGTPAPLAPTKLNSNVLGIQWSLNGSSSTQQLCQ